MLPRCSMQRKHGELYMTERAYFRSLFVVVQVFRNRRHGYLLFQDKLAHTDSSILRSADSCSGMLSSAIL